VWDKKYDRELDNFKQANLFIQVELELPISIPKGIGDEPVERRAMEWVTEASENLIRNDNSLIVIDNDKIVFIRMNLPNSIRIKPGDVVKPAPVMFGVKSSYLARRFGWALNLEYPEGLFVVLSNPDYEGEIFLENLSTGVRKYFSEKGWVKVHSAGVGLLPSNGEKVDVTEKEER